MKNRIGFVILLAFLVGYPFELNARPAETKQKNKHWRAFGKIERCGVTLGTR